MNGGCAHTQKQMKEYLVRLEAYRDVDGYRATHYAFHQVAFQLAH